jgi:hypothetical protein
MKKGDTVVRVNVWSCSALYEEDGELSVYITKPMILQSFGKSQGTATIEEDGKFIRRQLWAREEGVDLFLVDDEEGIAGAVERQKEYLLKRVARHITIDEDWLEKYPKAKEELKDKMRKSIKRLTEHLETPNIKLIDRRKEEERG